MARETSLRYYASKNRYPQPTFSVVDKSRRLFLLGVTALLALLIAAAIFYIGTHVKVVNLGYQINQEILRKENLIEENKRLSLEIARLTSPTRIEWEAVENLGLKMPQAGQILYLQNLGDPAVLAKWAPKPAKTTEAPPAQPQEKIKQPAISAKGRPALVQSPPKADPRQPTILKESGLEPLAGAIETSTTKKEPKVLAVKIVESAPSLKAAPAKSSKIELVSLQTKEAVPALMLDPMP